MRRHKSVKVEGKGEGEGGGAPRERERRRGANLIQTDTSQVHTLGRAERRSHFLLTCKRDWYGCMCEWVCVSCGLATLLSDTLTPISWNSWRSPNLLSCDITRAPIGGAASTAHKVPRYHWGEEVCQAYTVQRRLSASRYKEKGPIGKSWSARGAAFLLWRHSMDQILKEKNFFQLFASALEQNSASV